MTLMSPLFLLPLLFIGATASDGSEFYAKSFVDVLRNAIEFKNEAYLNSAFSDSFEFTGCKKNYNKREVLAILNSISSNGEMPFEFKSSHYIDVQNMKIEYVVAVDQSGVSIEASFVMGISNGNWQLISGQRSGCRKRFLGSAADSAESIAKTFMASMSSNSQNKVKLAALISDSFAFNGCISVYDKKMAVVAFSGSASELTINFESARFVNGDDVEYVVDLIRHGVSHEAQFTLHKENGVYVLFRGKVLKCPARRSFSVVDNSEPVAKSFISQLDGAIRSHDRDRIDGLFYDHFQFNGCKGVYNKQQVVYLLSNLKVNAAMSFVFKASRKLTNCIEYVVTVNGFGAFSFDAVFVIHPGNGQFKLLSGYIPQCPKLEQPKPEERTPVDTNLDQW